MLWVILAHHVPNPTPANSAYIALPTTRGKPVTSGPLSAPLSLPMMIPAAYGAGVTG